MEAVAATTNTEIQPKEDNMWLDVKKIADRYGCSVPTVYRRIKDGILPMGVRLSAKSTMWRLDALKKWEEKKLQEATGKEAVI